MKCLIGARSRVDPLMSIGCSIPTDNVQSARESHIIVLSCMKSKISVSPFNRKYSSYALFRHVNIEKTIKVYAMYILFFILSNRYFDKKMIIISASRVNSDSSPERKLLKFSNQIVFTLSECSINNESFLE
jgi:hypothetical protein